MVVGVVSIGFLLDFMFGLFFFIVISMDEFVLVYVVNVCFVEIVFNEII